VPDPTNLTDHTDPSAEDYCIHWDEPRIRATVRCACGMFFTGKVRGMS
jgi:hypothetical protein